MTTVKNIPKGGRIGRFARILKKELGEKIMLKVVQNSDKYKSFKPSEKSSWWMSAVGKLVKEVGKDKAENTMRLCGQKCCGQGTRKTAKRLMKKSKSLKEFLKRASTDGLKEGEVEYKLKDKNTITGTFHRCFCKQVSQAKPQSKNILYCQCSAEFHKQYFQAALEKPIKVEIKQSIINGAKTCKFIIHIGK